VCYFGNFVLRNYETAVAQTVSLLEIFHLNNGLDRFSAAGECVHILQHSMEKGL